LAEKWSKDASDLPRRMDIWIIFLRQAMLGSSGAGNISPAKAVEMIEAITNGLRSIRDTNANMKLILENLFLKI
jgi:hypothetical protein